MITLEFMTYENYETISLALIQFDIQVAQFPESTFLLDSKAIAQL
jgi:hypothetical protein